MSTLPRRPRPTIPTEEVKLPPSARPTGLPEVPDRPVKRGWGVARTLSAADNLKAQKVLDAVYRESLPGGSAFEADRALLSEYDDIAEAAAKRAPVPNMAQLERIAARAAPARRAAQVIGQETVQALRGIGRKAALKAGAKAVGKAALKGAGAAVGLATEIAFPNVLGAAEGGQRIEMEAMQGGLPPAYFIDESLMNERDRAAMAPWVEQPVFMQAWDKVNDMMMDDNQFHPSEIFTKAMQAEGGDPAAEQWLGENLGVVPSMEEAYGLIHFHGITTRAEQAELERQAVRGLFGPELPAEGE
jgi:hypothetical protein